ncbi:hypothetical protein GCM10010452_14550 [Crossiella cryophila]
MPPWEITRRDLAGSATPVAAGVSAATTPAAAMTADTFPIMWIPLLALIRRLAAPDAADARAGRWEGSRPRLSSADRCVRAPTGRSVDALSGSGDPEPGTAPVSLHCAHAR